MFTMAMRYSTPYTKDLRIRWYRLVEAEGKPVSEVCSLFGVPKKTYYKWYRRDHGLSPPRMFNRAAQRTTKLTPEIKAFIEKTKVRTNYGPAKMKLAVEKEFSLIVSSTIIYRYYKRKKLIRRPQKKLPWYKPMKERLAITAVGQGVQLDVKYVWQSGRRHYQFSVFDPFSELHYFVICPTRESKHAIAAFRQAEKYFGFKILSVQTDNGSEFRGVFHKWLTARSMPHYFIPKHSPFWNGKVERVHRTIDDEYYLNPQRPWNNPQEWLEYYNEERIHLSLNGLTPREKAAQCVTP